MSTAYKISGESLYYLTFQVVGWVDIFTRRIYRDMATQSFQFCQQHKGLCLYAFVIMSNHIHWLAQSETGDLSGIICDFKTILARSF